MKTNDRCRVGDRAAETLFLNLDVYALQNVIP